MKKIESTKNTQILAIDLLLCEFVRNFRAGVT